MTEESKTAELSLDIKALASLCNDRHVRVVQAILSDEYGSNTAAYMSVYPDSARDAANSSVAAILAIPSVKELYRAMRDEQVMEGVISRADAIKILSDMAGTSMGDLVVFSTIQGGTNENGEPILQAMWSFKDSSELDLAKLRSISELSSTRDGLKIKQHDQKAAIKQLAEMLGWNEAKEIKVSGLEFAGDLLYRKDGGK